MIYLLSTRVDLSFSLHKLAKFSSNPGNLHFEGLLYLLKYISENKTLGLKCCADTKYAPLSDLFKQASIGTKNQFIAFSGYSWQYLQTLTEVQEHI